MSYLKLLFIFFAFCLVAAFLVACVPAPTTPAMQVVIDAAFDKCVAAGGSFDMCVDYAAGAV